MRKNVLLKDGNDSILPITTIENVTGLNDIIDTVDTTYIYVGDCDGGTDVQYLILALEVPKKEMTWEEYLDNYKDLENISFISINDNYVKFVFMGQEKTLRFFNDNSGLWDLVHMDNYINIQKSNNSNDIHYAINYSQGR